MNPDCWSNRVGEWIDVPRNANIFVGIVTFIASVFCWDCRRRGFKRG